MIALLTLLLLIGVLGYLRWPLSRNSLVIAVWLFIMPLTGTLQLFGWLLWGLVFVLATIVNLPWLRRQLVSQPVMRWLKANLPAVSRTEQEALESGDVWWEAELFSGKPAWERLYDLKETALSEEERAFLDGPVDSLCARLDDWEITHERKDLPEEVWQFLRQQGFFGMIIPRAYGGLEFSALAHSEVVMKLASRSITAAVTVMVPNSLGPGQLLIHYGTEEQRQQYLPKLADGSEIPCFALTGPHAGSDASAIPDEGIVAYGEMNGEKTLGIRLNFNKRYITLAPVATLIGLAFHLYDPDGLLGDEEDVGITLALIPADTPGVETGRRHFPLNSAFQNGPVVGEDVFIPLEWIIGGREQAGKGWKMLVECLGEGRGISLPALSVAAAQAASRYTGAYARVRQQFGVAIGRFEGVEEPLARILGNSYLMNAGRKLTLSALDQGQRPAVVTALTKYQLTERMRQVVNDAMDIHAGSGICLGPDNAIGRAYQAIPIGITVEGANILTRTLIVFGQGALRCHPHLFDEMEAASQGNLEAFDRHFFAHLGFTISNLMRSIWFGLTNGIFEVSGSPATRSYCRRLTRLSANFALVADYALLTLGGSFKKRERLSGRLADMLANLYLCSAVIKHYEEQGTPPGDKVLVDYACRLTIHRAQQAMLAAFHNLPLPFLAKTIRSLMFPIGKPYSPPDDKTIHQVARLALAPSSTRDRLSGSIFWSSDPDDRMGKIEHAFQQVIACEDIEKRLKQHQRNGEITQRDRWRQLDEAVAKGYISDAEKAQLAAMMKAVDRAIAVDAFSAL